MGIKWLKAKASRNRGIAFSVSQHYVYLKDVSREYSVIYLDRKDWDEFIAAVKSGEFDGQ